MIQRSLAELRQECLDLCLPVVQLGKKEAKADYLAVLQAHFLQGKVKTFGLQYRLSMASPALCFLYSNLRGDEYNALFDDSNVAFEEKINGCRMLCMYNPVTGFEFFSRNISVQDYCPVDYTEKIWLGGQEYRGLFPAFVLDCEIISRDPNISTILEGKGVVTETILQACAALLELNTEDSIQIQKDLGGPLALWAFDCLYYDGIDLRKATYKCRREVLAKIIPGLKSVGLPFHKVKSILSRKREYLELVWSQPEGEGVVAKQLDGIYLDRESRPRGGWVKIKKKASGSLADHIDGVITGYELGEPGKGFENYVACLLVSVPVKWADGHEDWHIIAKAPNLPFSTRKMITIMGRDGKPCLDPSYYGKVVEVDGQSISPRALRLMHPRLCGWRPDKSSENCRIYEESELRALIG